MKTKKRFLAAMMAAVMIMTLIPFGLVASAESTYEIATAEQLVAFATAFNGGTLGDDVTVVKLTADIDMTGVTSWAPIGGKATNPFDLTFDGNGKVIKNLDITAPEGTAIGGVFGYVSGTVKNLAVADSEYTFAKSKVTAGLIAANVTASGVIQGCAAYNSTISVDYDSASLQANYIGGLVGDLSGTVNESYNKAIVAIEDNYGVNYAGGIAGKASNDAIVSNCYNGGHISAITGVYNVAGGLVGRALDATVYNVYNVGLVAGDISAAVIGWVGDTTNVKNCYYLDTTSSYESLLSTNESYTGKVGSSFTIDANLPVANVNEQDEAFVDSTRADYIFPLLKNNSFDDATTDSPAEDTTNFAGGMGTVYSPYVVNDTAMFDLISDPAYKYASFKLGDDITLNNSVVPFEPIKSFIGSIDGNGKSIFGMEISATDSSDPAVPHTSELAFIINNYGLLKNFTIADSTVTDPVTVTSVSLDTFTNEAYVATVAAHNFGTIDTVTSEADVTVFSTQMKVYAAGIAAENNGVIKNCTNKGTIVVDNTAVISTDNYKAVYEGAVVDVAGLVAVNNATGSVSGSSSNTARSVLTSASDTDGIVEAQYVAVNNGGKIGTTSDATAKHNYFEFVLNQAVVHTKDTAYSNDNPIDLSTSTVKVNGTTTADIVTTYSDLVGNYQRISLVVAGEYNAVFFTWLDYKDITVDSSNAKKAYLQGDNLLTSGLKVTAKDATDATVSLSKVEDESSNGYTVRIYDGDTLVPELSDVTFDGVSHTYTVKLYYYGTYIEGSAYDITVYGVKSFTVTPEYTSYLVGAKPTFTVKAVYADPSNTTRSVKDGYTYAIGTSTNFDGATYGNDATFTKTGDNYISVKMGDKTGVSDKITVIAADSKVSNLEAKSGDDDSTVECDNIKLTWDYAGADSSNVTFKIERKPVLDVSGMGLNIASIMKIANSLEYSVLKTGVKGTSYIDTKAAAGTEYKYKVTVVVSGTESTATSDEVKATAAEPQSYAITAPTGKDKYFALGSEFKRKGVEVVATYANGTKSELSYSAEDSTETLKYSLDSSDYNANKAGTYTINVKHVKNAGVLGIGTSYSTVGSYEVTVLNPTAISDASSEYTYYPVNYKEADFKKTLTVKMSYISPEGDTIATKALEDMSSVTLTGYDSSAVSTAEQKVNVKSSLCTNDTTGKDIKIYFVTPTVPTNVTAEANLNGTVSVTWNKVPGARGYNLYRSTSESGTYELVETVKDTATLAGTGTKTKKDDSDALTSGETYYYKVSALIADTETDKSAASNAATVVVPAYFEVETSGAHTAFGVGEKFTTSGLKVFAYYNMGTDAEPDYEKKQIGGSKYTTNVTTNDGVLDTVGSQNISISIKNVTGKPITYLNNGVEMATDYYTITVYPLYSISATTKDKSYPVGYEFSKEDIKLKAIYGDATVEADKRTVSAKDEGFVIANAPDMTSQGAKNVKVTYSGLETTVTVNVYDPNGTVTVQGRANEDTTASLIINTETLKFVDTYIITRSDSYDMDTNIVTKTVKMKEDTPLVAGMYEYRDTSVGDGLTYYYTVTPKFTDGATGESSAFVQVTTKTVAEIIEILPVEDKGITRKDNYTFADTTKADVLVVKLTAKDGIDVSTFVGDDIENSDTQIKVFTSDGMTPVTTGKIATGYIINLYAATDTTYTTPIDSVIVIVLGDVNGDGKVSLMDYGVIKTHTKPSGGTPITLMPNLAAADYNLDGKVSLQDYGAIKTFTKPTK